VNPRAAGVAHVLRQQPYEAALALALAVSALASLRAGAGSGAAARVLPHWMLRPAALLLAGADLLTLAGLLAAGAALADVPRVLARRVEQAGQLLQGGVLAAIAVGALSAGPPGTVTGSVYTALAAAGAARAAVIGHVLKTAGRERTDLG